MPTSDPSRSASPARNARSHTSTISASGGAVAGVAMRRAGSAKLGRAITRSAHSRSSWAPASRRKAADEEGLVVVHHSFSVGYPGYRDLWQNPFLGRMASHPWGGMRFVAAMVCSGILDRYPNLNLAILESGFGWLPFWAKRMDDQVDYVGYVADLQHKPSEYMAGGRFFASIVLHEGPDMVDVVNQTLGNHILMFGSDYPHSESRFPESVDRVLGWENLTPEQLQKLLWDNPVRAFGQP